MDVSISTYVHMHAGVRVFKCGWSHGSGQSPFKPMTNVSISKYSFIFGGLKEHLLTYLLSQRTLYCTLIYETSINVQYLHGSFQRLLDVKTLACDCRVEFSLKRQKVHISLRFGN